MKIPPALRRLLIAVPGQTEAYVKPAALPMYGLRELAAQLIGLSRRLKFAPTSLGGAARPLDYGCRPGHSSPHDGFPVSKRFRGRAAIGQRVRRYSPSDPKPERPGL